MRPERFELPTCCSGGNRSIQLSYGRARIPTVYMGRGKSFNGGLSTSLGIGADSDLREREQLSQEQPSWAWRTAGGGCPHIKQSLGSKAGLASSGRAAHRRHHRPGHHDLRGRDRRHLHRRRCVRSWGALR